ncbi:kinase-like domain-containing protein [Crucibulum laeve]|uniref:Kinase-like domain-containing protein n=2 Tax=Crucibulum laeve TaxID=68775 RepID=A0A5C3LU57_9AGAR|nr:kinase-like domain-containing protein [Crucibulum laeve]
MGNQKLGEVCGKLLDIFGNRSKYKLLLSYRDEEAQSILNLSQALLYTPYIGSRLKNELVVAIQRLSEKSALCPECFTLKDVVIEGEYPISAGQFGEVWKGIFSRQSVSLKVVKAYRHSQIHGLLRAFSREAVLWGQLSHENVLPFYGVFALGSAHKRICLVSPWMDNGDINNFLTENPSANRTLLICDVASGVGYLHQNNIIHGDLKGPNILVTSAQRACLADFGLSTIRDPEVLRMTSSVGHTGGTVRWMAPELLDPEHERINSKESDIYAFACVCYEESQIPFYEILRDETVSLKVNKGYRPSRPVEDSPPFVEWGLTALMWRLMEDCWNQEISDRPHARNILRRLPTVDTHPRDPTSSGYISPSLFRTVAGADLDKYVSDSRILRLLDVGIMN